MEPDRWREVERLYHAALERDPEARGAFLAEASGGDEELVDEVQSLLEQHSGDSRLDRAVWEPKGESTDTRFVAGTQLGQYRIEAPLGAGGMGEVFRARDTRLNRTVAIKISQRRFTGRFKSEARASAALNHPNIVQIYELGSEAGDDFIVMEFVPGRTLFRSLRLWRLLTPLGSCIVTSSQATSSWPGRYWAPLPTCRLNRPNANRWTHDR